MVRLVSFSSSDFAELTQRNDREVGEIKWSVGVLGGSVKVHESRVRRFKARFRRRSMEDNLGIAGADAFIRVMAEDDGLLEIQLYLANFSSKPILIEQVGSDWLSVEHGPVVTTPGTLLPSIRPIPSRSIEALTIRFAILPPGIRSMANHIRPGPYKTSSPSAHIHLRGTLVASQGRARAAIPFEVHVPTPGVDWPATSLLPSN